MKKYSFFFLIFLFVLCSVDAFQDSLKAFGNKQEEPRIFVNNRILARVNGKAISTYDLMKKMDLSFYRHYPEYASSIPARAQYYDMHWKLFLEDLIDKELILADAQESKVEISSGDIRQEIESSFGPNIIANLDKAGMSYEEASKMMQEELIIRRMMGGRVHVKALSEVTPIKIKRAYEEFVQDPKNMRHTQWSYQIITIKDGDAKKTEAAARAVYQMLLDGIPLDQLLVQLKQKKVLGKKGKVTISTILKNHDEEISEDYRKVMAELDTGMYSQPFAHKSRQSKAPLYRILLIHEKIAGGVPSFKEMEGPLKNKLLDLVVMEKETEYLNKLKQHYHVDIKDILSSLPPDYQPFVLK